MRFLSRTLTRGPVPVLLLGARPAVVPAGAFSDACLVVMGPASDPELAGHGLPDGGSAGQ